MVSNIIKPKFVRKWFKCTKCGRHVSERDYEELTWYAALEDLGICEQCANQTEASKR